MNRRVPIEGTTDMDRMVAELADAAMARFYSAQKDGLTEHQAFQEIIRTVLTCYREAMAS